MRHDHIEEIDGDDDDENNGKTTTTQSAVPLILKGDSKLSGMRMRAVKTVQCANLNGEEL